jgi:uncharacterized protein (TIGR02466 family)
MKNNTSENAEGNEDLKKESYFPTLIYYQDLPEASELNQTIKSHLYDLRSSEPDGIVRSNVKRVGSWHSPDDLNKRDEYRQLSETISASAQRVFQDAGYDPAYEPAVDNMWAIINPRYGFNRNHTHPNVLWSGVYYVQAPPNCGRIFFTDPRPQASVLIPRYVPDEPRKPEFWSEVYYEAIEGRLLMFPSWLVHEVEPNMSEAEGSASDRIAISFNLGQRRRDAA